MEKQQDLPMPKNDSEMIAILAAAVIALQVAAGLPESSKITMKAFEYWSNQPR